MSAGAISVIVEEPAWKKSGVALRRVKSATRIALAHMSFLSHAKRGGGAPKGRRGQVACAVPSTAEFILGPAIGRTRVRSANTLSPSPPTLRAGEGNYPGLTLLLTNDERLRALNGQFRGKDAPTNVLSFPAAGVDGYLGDIAIALGVTSRESAASGISLEAHTLHLAVHGVLHLLGYDHVRSREARVMERLEITILDELGIPNPYAVAKR